MRHRNPWRNSVRHTLLAATAAFVIGSITTGAVLSQAQPAPTPTQEESAPHHLHHHGFGRRTFGLIYRQEDRQLAPADVQKIAEAFLLWNGNHAWKVSDVAATTAGPIAFNLTTPEGSVVAKFTMDPHTGHIHRVG
jgi:hypothetical protein